jgi:hypothetical protein
MSKVTAGAVGLIAALGVAALTTGISRAALQVRHDDQVHYFGHLLAGRVVSLWPGGAALAEQQYARGMYHAHTPRRKALLTTARPRTWRERLLEALELVTALARRVAV